MPERIVIAIVCVLVGMWGMCCYYFLFRFASFFSNFFAIAFILRPMRDPRCFSQSSFTLRYNIIVNRASSTEEWLPFWISMFNTFSTSIRRPGVLPLASSLKGLYREVSRIMSLGWGSISTSKSLYTA